MSWPPVMPGGGGKPPGRPVGGLGASWQSFLKRLSQNGYGPRAEELIDLARTNFGRTHPKCGQPRHYAWPKESHTWLRAPNKFQKIGYVGPASPQTLSKTTPVPAATESML